jgi:hypothetical protein
MKFYTPNEILYSKWNSILQMKFYTPNEIDTTGIRKSSIY